MLLNVENVTLGSLDQNPQNDASNMESYSIHLDSTATVSTTTVDAATATTSSTTSTRWWWWCVCVHVREHVHACVSTHTSLKINDVWATI